MGNCIILFTNAVRRPLRGFQREQRFVPDDTDETKQRSRMCGLYFCRCCDWDRFRRPCVKVFLPLPELFGFAFAFWNHAFTIPDSCSLSSSFFGKYILHSPISAHPV